jgi:hypothetical protein
MQLSMLLTFSVPAPLRCQLSGVIALSDMLRVNSTIKGVLLSDNKLGTRAITSLSEMLKTNTTLRRLELANIGLNDERAFLLAESLKSNIALRDIVLTKNEMSAAGGQHFDNAMRFNTVVDVIWGLDGGHRNIFRNSDFLRRVGRNDTTITEIWTHHLVGREGSCGDPEAEAISRAVKDNTHVKEIWLANGKISDIGAEACSTIVSLTPPSGSYFYRV